jgi:hypothetical protein
VDARDSIDKMRQHEATARIFAAVGSAITVVGGFSLFYDLRSSRPRRTGVTPGVACGPSGCWVAARGRF